MRRSSCDEMAICVQCHKYTSGEICMTDDYLGATFWGNRDWHCVDH